MVRIAYFFGIAFATTPLPYDDEYTTGHSYDWATNPYYTGDEYTTSGGYNRATSPYYADEEWTTFQEEPMTGIYDYRYENTTPFPNTFTPPYDICRQVCDALSSNRGGNGYDLCDAPQQSQCVYNMTIDREICTNLYWSETEEGEAGLVYETDVSGLTAEEFNRPLGCMEAGDLLYGYQPMQFTTMYDSTNHLNIALDLFVHSRVGQRYLSREPNPVDSAYYIHQYARNSSNETVENLRQVLARPELRSVDGSLAQIAVMTHTVESFAARLTINATCGSCRNTSQFEEIGAIPLIYDVSNRTMSVQSFLPRFLNISGPSFGYCETCHCPCERDVSAATLYPGTEMLAISLMRNNTGMGNLTIPQRLNLTGLPSVQSINRPLYRLYAIASNRHNATAIMRIGNDWFSTNGTGLIPTNQPEEEITLTGFETLALYEQVDRI